MNLHKTSVKLRSTEWCDTDPPDIFSRGEDAGYRTLTFEEIDEAMMLLAELEWLVEVRVEERQLGRGGTGTTSDMHSTIRDYWQKEEEQDLPEEVRARLLLSKEERDRMGTKTKRTRQSTLTGNPMSQPGATMLPTEHRGEPYNRGCTAG